MMATIKYVSEDKVNFLQFIIDLLSSEDGLKLISAILGLFTGGQTAQDGDDTPDPEIEEMFNQIAMEKQNSPKEFVGEGFALSPICNVANKDVIYMLTRYFGKSN